MTSNVDVYKSVDYKKIYIQANEILASSSVIEMFPYKISAFLKEQADIRLISYAKAMNKYGIDVRTFGSESAVLQEMDGANIIFYNQDEPDYRVRFSIMHEFGHYLFNHKKNLKADEFLYQQQEMEANIFAAQMLMPEQLLREVSKRGKCITYDLIKECFTVSKKAAEKRKSTLSKTDYEWRSRQEKMYDDIIVTRHMLLIERMAPKNRYNDYVFEEEYERQRERESWY